MAVSVINSGNLLISGGAWLRSLLDRDWNTQPGMPPFVSIEPSNYCNLHCPECAIGSGMNRRPSGFIDIELFRKITVELRPWLLNLNLYFQGEPMLHPEFFSLLEISRGINTTVSTNGHFLDGDNAGRLVRSGLGKLIVSVDGADQLTYSRYRVGGSLDKVVEGLRLVASAKKRFRSRMKLVIQMLVNSYNDNQIKEVRQIAHEHNADFSLKSMQILSQERIGNWMPQIEKYRRYKEKDSIFINKNRLPDRCARLWLNPVITWDGKVLPCCFDKDADHIMGDLNYVSFRNIWNGPEFRSFRHDVSNNRKKIDICRNCTSGLTGVKY